MLLSGLFEHLKGKVIRPLNIFILQRDGSSSES